tara:strand:- start:22793 stop:23701 length:909 start_codon:yes stop_codon:yes gene_type:complete
MDVSIPSGSWMILPTAIEELALIHQQWLQMLQSDDPAVKAYFNEEPEQDEVDLSDCTIIDNVAIIPLHGVLVRYPNWMTRWFGATSTEEYASKIEVLADREDVEHIIQDVNTPGGVVPGLDDAWERIDAVRKRISIISVCNEMMASAGVYLGSCADEIILPRNGMMGSIGVIQERLDWTKHEAETGRLTRVVTAGKYKGASHPSVPFNSDYQALYQNMTDRFYETFLQVVAVNRKTTIEDVLNNMADAKIFIGQQAVDVGLADRVGTLRQLVAELTGPNHNQPFNYGDEDDGEEYYARWIEN